MKKQFIGFVFFIVPCFAKGPVGLSNQGATCYQNASLQCLNNLNELSDFLLNKKPEDYFEEFVLDFDYKKISTIAPAYINLIKSLRGNQKSYNPIGFCQKAGKHGFPKGVQMDAQEFVNFLLNRLADREVNSKYKLKYDPPAQDYIKTKIGEMFDVFLQSFTESSDCPKTSDKKLEPQKILSVEIQDQNKKTLKSLQACLKNFTDGELLTGDNKWFCEKTGKYVDAQRKIELYSVSQFLIIHLKRFSFTQKKQGENFIYSASKLNNAITFPLQGLNVNPYLAKESPQKDLGVYDLVGVTIHQGSYTLSGGKKEEIVKKGTEVPKISSSGHYWAYIKTDDGQWYEANDSVVTKMNLNTIKNFELQGYIQNINATPYVLYYKRRAKHEEKKEPEWLGDKLTEAQKKLIERLKNDGISPEYTFFYLVSIDSNLDVIMNNMKDEFYYNRLKTSIEEFKEIQKQPEKDFLKLAQDLVQLEVELSALKMKLDK